MPNMDVRRMFAATSLMLRVCHRLRAVMSFVWAYITLPKSTNHQLNTGITQIYHQSFLILQFSQCRQFQEDAKDASVSEWTWTLSALAALRNALYKFKTYLLTYLQSWLETLTAIIRTGDIRRLI